MILDNKYSLNQLKQLRDHGLQLLAKELREKIIHVVSENGGHLASNLGAVELAIAVHYVFNSPEDKIIWDVGHQAYAHKILTDRNKTFNTIRKYKGLSGFPKRCESPHDAFGVGHSSTSISAAIGIKKGLEKKNDESKVIAIIGDGALTGGIAFEALNFIGEQQDDVIIIVNTNDMSISPNVGALSEYLTKIIKTPAYNKIRDDIWNLLGKIPMVPAKKTRYIGKKIEESVKGFLTPGTLFEELGMKYYGPVDGHNIRLLVNTLRDIKDIKGPKLLQIITQKGKGYKFAEENATKFHGVGEFKIDTGETPVKKRKSYTEVFGDFLKNKAAEDDKICAITAAMPDGTGTSIMQKEYPERVYDVGIAEQHAACFAAGLAAEGAKPFLAVYSTFFQRAYDQYIHDIALQKLPVRVCLDRGGLVGEDGPTHHGAFDLSFMQIIPNTVIMAPKDQAEFENMLDFMASYNELPTVIRYPRGKVIEEDKLLQSKPVELGKMEVLKDGKKILFIAFGRMVYPAYEISEMIDEEISSEIKVINLRFLKPIDKEIISELKNADYVFTFEENALIGGMGSRINDLAVQNRIKAEITNIGIEDEFIPHGSLKEIFDYSGLSKEKMFERILYKLKDAQN